MPASAFLGIGSNPLCDQETDPNCEDAERGHISGTILIPGVSNANASAAGSLSSAPTSGPSLVALTDPALRRRVYAAAAAFARTDSGFRQEVELLRPSSADPLSRPRRRARPALGTARTKNKLPPSAGLGPVSQLGAVPTMREEWRDGEVIFRTRTAARGHRAMWTKRFEEHLAGMPLDTLPKLSIGLCNTETVCLLTVTTDDGKLLDPDATRSVADALAELEDLRYATVNRIKYAFKAPNDDYYQYQWHYGAMNLEAAWDITTGSDEVYVAIVDSGILTGHPDLSPRFAYGADVISDSSISNDGDGRDDNAADPGDNACGNGCHSHHGSHVAGTIGAATNNANLVAGVSWQSNVLMARALGQGSQGTTFDILAGISWAIGESVEGVSQNPNPADVINLSLGGPGEDPATDDAISEAIATGAIVIVAAGNSNENAGNISPANSPGAITIAAVGNGAGEQPYRAPYSCFGDVVAVAAPGGDVSEDRDGDGFPDGVLSTMGGEADFQQGTSMAAPHVAGLAVLMKSIDPNLNQDAARALLVGNADPDIDCPEGCGAGLVDAARTLLALEGRANEPLVTANPGTVRLGKGETQAELTLKNVGGAASDVSVSVSGPGREKVSVSGAAGNLAAGADRTVSVTIDRAADEVGEASLQFGWGQDQVTEARLIWTDDEVLIPELVGVFALIFPDDEDGDVIVERGVPTTNAEGFDYKLFNLRPDIPYIIAGLSDDDGDEEFEPETEGIGIYRTINDPIEVATEAAVNITGVDFAVAPSFSGEEVQEGDGDSPLGGGCDLDSDCESGLFCDPSLPGGYCTKDCSFEACGGDGVCFTFTSDGSEFQLCLDGCANDTDCRQNEGYICDTDDTCFYYAD